MTPYKLTITYRDEQGRKERVVLYAAGYSEHRPPTGGRYRYILGPKEEGRVSGIMADADELARGIHTLANQGAGPVVDPRSLARPEGSGDGNKDQASERHGGQP